MRCKWALVTTLATVAACSGVGYTRQVGEFGETEPAESISFESRDSGDLARLFAEELKQSPIYQELRTSGGEKQPPAIAHSASHAWRSARQYRSGSCTQQPGGPWT